LPVGLDPKYLVVLLEYIRSKYVIKVYENFLLKHLHECDLEIIEDEILNSAEFDESDLDEVHSFLDALNVKIYQIAKEILAKENKEEDE
jgi:hypothetical protein